MGIENLILRPYQCAGAAWAIEKPFSGLFYPPGLGKTPTALSVLLESLYDRLDSERWLVVGPKLVVADAWPRQLRRWREFEHLTYRNLTSAEFDLKADTVEVRPGEKRRVGLTFGGRADKAAVKKRLLGFREDIHFCSYSQLPWLARALGSNWCYDGVIVDESIFVANSTTDVHKALYNAAHRLKAVKRMILLNGQPTPNRIEQLHGQVRLLDDGARLGRTKTEFESRFMVPAKKGPNGVVWNWKPAAGAFDTITRLTSELCVSLKASDYLQLPELIINPIPITLPEQARAQYDQLERDLVIDVAETEILAPSAGVLANKLLQLASGAIYAKDGRWLEVHRAKIQALDELLDSVDGPVLLAYAFQHEWERIRKHHRHAVHIHDPGALDRFRRGEIKLLALHPASGGHGIDGLQDASCHAIWFGPSWNADHFGQFNARLHRDGQRSNRVTVHQLVAQDTIEDHIAGSVLPQKIEDQELLLQALKMRRLG